MPTKTPPFSWRNYFSPTPQNLQYAVEILHGGVVLIATTTAIQGNPYWSTIIMLGGYFLDKLSKFFGKVAKDAMTTIEVTVPANTDIHVSQSTTETTTKEETIIPSE